MKNFLREGKAMHSPYILSMIIFCVLFSSAFAQSVGERAVAKAQQVIEPLKVGDEIPEALWNLPLKVVNHPEGKEFIKLSDYRDKKLIILDFWGTWCGSCIGAFPDLKQLDDKFGKDIIVVSLTNEKLKKVNSFLASNEIAKSVNLWSVVEDSVITKYITKYNYPHFTWIADGKIISNTSRSALKEKFVADYLDTKRIGWAEKVNLNIRTSFFSSLGDLSSSTYSYYIEGYLSGAGKGGGEMPYGNGKINYFFINHTQREVFEWFLNRIAKINKEELKSIDYSTVFVNSESWKVFNETPVSAQIITSDKKPLEEVLNQLNAMASIKLEIDSVGDYTWHKSSKEAKL